MQARHFVSLTVLHSGDPAASFRIMNPRRTQFMVGLHYPKGSNPGPFRTIVSQRKQNLFESVQHKLIHL